MMRPSFFVLVFSLLLNIIIVEPLLFRKVLVSKSIVAYTDTNYRKMVFSKVPGLLAFIEYHCTSKCLSLSWCRLWCHDPENSQCILSNIAISPGYDGGSGHTDILTCYTYAIRDLIVGSTMTASSFDPISPERTVANLLDGIYEFRTTSDCAKTADELEPWISIDFGQEKSFSHIKITAKYGSDAVKLTKLEMWYGKEGIIIPDQLEQFRLFAYYDGVTEENQELSFSSSTPVVARYVVIRMMKKEKLQFCHIQIYQQ